MAIFRYKNISITGISACLPKQVIDNRTFSDFFTEEEVNKVIQMTSIKYRRCADKNMAASDFGFHAASNLIEDMGINASDIDGLIFCSVTPDYRMPATAFILQDRLGLTGSALCFDLNMGCSGYVYALNMAHSLLSGQELSRILVVNSHVVMNEISRCDRAVSLLFGDGATATLVEKTSASAVADVSYFSLNSDGSGYKFIIKEAGGYRNPTSPDSLQEKVRPDGSIRTDEQASMDGPAVFDFTITEVPKDISKVMSLAEKGVADVDFFVLHQANLFIMKHIGRKLKIPMEKIPVSLDRFGNLSSVSLPLTIVSELANSLKGCRSTLLLSAFGVGLSWGSAVISMDDPYIGEIVEI